MSDVDDRRFINGVRLFNERKFFACHDELEELWSETLGDERRFYQGLIHAAVALHHFEEENLTGARKMYESAGHYLRPFAPSHRGVDLEAFLAGLRDCFAPLLIRTNKYPTGAAMDPNKIPDILLDRGVVRTEATS